MSSRIILPRLNHASNFNFFFNNSKRNLLVEQSFIGNQFLLRKRRYMAKLPVGESCGKSSLNDVASKVLNCHDDDAKKPVDLQAGGSGHIPFKVTPKVAGASSEDKILNKQTLAEIASPYIKLTKPRLTVLVTLSAMCSYALSPHTVSLPELVFLLAGTGLSSAAANAINMGREPKFDKLMARTSGRPVVTGALTSEQAFKFAAVLGSAGVALLYLGVNPVVAVLGFLNIVLYSWIYTSLKRKHIINTWVGALVGAIPPLMGWAASSSLTHPGVWCLAGLLYAWQFPHFNALLHNIADQYKNAGYVMTASENPRLNARVALRYSILMFPLCIGLAYYGVTDWVFPFDSAIVNTWLTYWAYKFWDQQRKNYPSFSSSSIIKKVPTAEGINLANIYAKKVFWGSVWHLPVVLILAMLHKKGQWDRLLEYIGFKRNERLT